MHDKHIVVGVTGGIAAYKACALVSKLTQKGAQVKVVMTSHAAEFVKPLTFQALSRQPVYTDTFDEKDPEKIAHIDVADWADIVILAPATANILGKLANGIGDDMLSTVLLATQADVYIAPAMNVHMYAHPAVMANMKTLEERGCNFIEPGAGYLACGYVGKGRLEEPESIIETIERHQAAEQNLYGKTVLITAGPTREAVDPVRFFSNRSSGKMGFRLAETAAQRGAKVILICGPVALSIQHKNIERIDVTTAEEMYEAVHKRFEEADIVIKAAAVADYRPKNILEQKLKKQPGDFQVEMERTKDILMSLGERKQDQYIVGFAAETNDPLENGKDKLKRKNLDAIVVNDVTETGAGFQGDTNKAIFINKLLQEEHMPLTSKQEMANHILSLVVRDLEEAAM
ncbi:Phosphopantothenoylcysteine decarboxylase [Lentibacillus sp. JNUCC-1]|uniref:bifunctional phosphopantothenoylcysteine decarboxylase/phosphopantothenate--cysteine ligase CoaBC n=1 Tax=Lentibacillus sp. JNUCC-1 TaxID=2654513 RepID=UPI0012E76C77|nr:bifunctional phosphopantothenoylcysteine decarboxylase/phosphopantothenate--cysteine ligase CoaBC [Lentibacillus sp. JNUCC-1]MUV40020.1 Phosphopantothenoylcysteine decarboxylase [Lentibacillus sp. JNUCC-1]